ncbi:putative membrane protein [Streptosporangium becharense]|uniref:Putative membrane protein n=1 Tax=Streptosporangium becharense TaxID=1816182 RepID=A0A7W9IJJ7_9ACTN|nr:SHOCT domain-containing protein [Streptosporangium becharense]MBB2910999.1 putative membrane protein [Streptosporangium becharense]MBB5821943.1 putative membrane protein [Streptosporangium becharense]
MIRIVMLLFVIVVIVVVIVGAAEMLRSIGALGPLPDEPREILRRRYASGEIDEDEYFRRMSGLSQDW